MKNAKNRNRMAKRSPSCAGPQCTDMLVGQTLTETTNRVICSINEELCRSPEAVERQLADLIRQTVREEDLAGLLSRWAEIAAEAHCLLKEFQEIVATESDQGSITQSDWSGMPGYDC